MNKNDLIALEGIIQEESAAGQNVASIELLAGNGDNRFCIVVKCENEVCDMEWAEIIFLLNDALSKHDGGKFSNVGAFLEEAS